MRRVDVDHEVQIRGVRVETHLRLAQATVRVRHEPPKQIRDLRAQMADDRRRNDVNAYNLKVPRVNALVKQYNDDIAQYNRLSRSLLGPELPDVAQ